MNLKTDFECLEMIHNNSSCDFTKVVKVTNCDNCEVLKEKVKYFIKTVSKFSMGIANLYALLDSQNCVFNKVGISFQYGFEKKVKKLKKKTNYR